MTTRLKDLEKFLYTFDDREQWVQTTPILPNVWREFVLHPGELVDVLLTPTRNVSPGELSRTMQKKLLGKNPSAKEVIEKSIAHNQTLVAAKVSFSELIEHVVPLSKWYFELADDSMKAIRKMTSSKLPKGKLAQLIETIADPEKPQKDTDNMALWWLKIVNFVNSCAAISDASQPNSLLENWSATTRMIESTEKAKSPLLFRVFLNRPASVSSLDGIKTVKADAAKRVFDVDASSITWAVLDSGIDARHPAFRQNSKRKTPCRVTETYDFTRLRKLIALASAPGDASRVKLDREFGIKPIEATKIAAAMRNGQSVDWEALKPGLEIRHTPARLRDYGNDLHPHGTHVAGVLGGLPNKTDDGLEFHGVCPDINLIDIRVLDKNGNSKDAEGHPEFDILGALQFIAHLNSIGNEQKVHGVNLSVQLKHIDGDFACGRTPVCDECNSLSNSGVVVVAAAGNFGIDKSSTASTTQMGAIRDISITDPGNAANVITVGSTHRKRPFEYGVSYFSGRGPTGDGRQKPDLIAPGEKILGPVGRDSYETMQGTSQAAPYVSGAAAMLMSRYSELIGDPTKIKEILCRTATDLGREKQFQGAGLVDVLRAMQSV